MALQQPLPDLVSLDLLRSVAELGSIRQAAQVHGISQPAASTRLRSLERAIGLELLDRSSGRARLTSTGRAVVQWSEQILDSTHVLLASIEALKNDEQGQLKLAASMTVAEYLIPGWLIRLRSTSPEIQIALQMGNSAHVIELVASRQVELGFVEGRSVLAGLQFRTVALDELVLVVAPHHPWARRRRPVSAAELAATPLVLREAGSGTREVLEAALLEMSLEVAPLVELGSTTAIKSAVQSGIGPAVLSRLAVRAEVLDGRLAVVECSEVSLDRSIRAIWPKGRQLAPRAKQLLAQIG